MAAAAILKNSIIAISLKRFDRWAQEFWHNHAYWPSKLDQQLKFRTFKTLRWRTATILKNRKISIINGRY